MADFGYSFIIGRPLSAVLTEAISDALGSFAVPHATLWHATLANGTAPAGRSLREEASARSQAPECCAQLRQHLIPILRQAIPFRIRFRQLRISAQGATAACEPHPQLEELITAIQGGLSFVTDRQIGDVTGQGAVIGINKYAAHSRNPARTVSITLSSKPFDGETDREIRFPAVDEEITGVRFVFYRDRRLYDAVVSSELRFGATAQELKESLLEFQHQLA